MLKMRDYSQAQKLCRSLEFNTENCRFETYPADFPGVKGNMVSFAFQYFDAIIPYLLDKNNVFFTYIEICEKSKD